MDFSKYHQREGSLYKKAHAALNDAHRACFNHPDRDVLGMSHGPFSGVNVALGIIASLECDLARAKHKIEQLERLKKSST